jgi:hypothetical protein
VVRFGGPIASAAGAGAAGVVATGAGVSLLPFIAGGAILLLGAAAVASAFAPSTSEPATEDSEQNAAQTAKSEK